MRQFIQCSDNDILASDSISSISTLLVEEPHPLNKNAFLKTIILLKSGAVYKTDWPLSKIIEVNEL